MTSSAVPDPSPAAGQDTVLRGSAVWLPPGAPPVTVGDYTITGGLVYVGSALPAPYAAMFEPALIDPKLPVRRVRLDQETPADGDRPAYADLTAGARAAYLEWLAGGRAGPTPLAHLWLFLYGLERRVLVDLAGRLGGTEEYAAIGAELGALRLRYGDLSDVSDADRPAVTAFDRQAAALADLVAALAGLGDPGLRPPPPPAGAPADELPIALRVGLGRFVAGRQPISAAWALAWYAHHPDRLREAATTAVYWPAEHERTFTVRYEAAYPDGGLIIPSPGRELVLAYEPASPGFAGRTVRVHTQLPDVAGLPAPLSEDEPPTPVRPPAPAPATGQRTFEAFDELDLDTVEAAVRRARAEVNPPPPPQAAPPPPPPPTVEPELEPEPEPEPDEQATAAAAQRPHLAAAEALLRLVTVAGLDEAQVRAVRRYAVDALGLGVADRHQLDDALDHYAHQRPAADTIRQRFGALSAERQDAVAELLIATAGANGVLEPVMVAMLGAVFTLLGPGPGELHRRLSEIEVASVSFDSAPDAPTDTTVLDPDQVERTLAGAADAAAQVGRLTAPRAGGTSRWYATTTAGSVIT